MGLDMFLFKIKKGCNPKENEGKIGEIAYWRKANAVRRWFVDNCGYNENSNCEYFEIDKNDIYALLRDAIDVYNKHDAEYSARILPTSMGFFFGDTEYDEWYYDNIGNTIRQLSEVLTTVDWEEEDVYYYEWW